MVLGAILGGGGAAGVAWEAGIVIGLQQAGVDLSSAGLVVGTSAGSIVGSYVACAADLRTLAAARYADMSPGTGPADGAAAGLEPVLTALAPIFDPTLDRLEARRRVGVAACAAETGDEQAHIARIAALLPAREGWPPLRFLVTAVDTESGQLTVWHSGRGVPLGLAVASSCAVPGAYPPVTIGSRRYMDGGVRSTTNADLAVGVSAVIVLDAVGHLTPRGPLQAELATLGTDSVLVITPDEAAAALIGGSMLDPATWPAALEAGLAQAASCAAPARAIWPATAS